MAPRWVTESGGDAGFKAYGLDVVLLDKQFISLTAPKNHAEGF